MVDEELMAKWKELGVSLQVMTNVGPMTIEELTGFIKKELLKQSAVPPAVPPAV
jgi:hypothetical protein